MMRPHHFGNPAAVAAGASSSGPVMRGTSAGTLSGGTVANLPAGVQAGDVLAVSLAVGGGSPAAPSGWTRSQDVPGITSHALYTRVAAGGDSFTLGAGVTGVYHAFAVSGGSAVDTTGSAPTGTAPSVTTTAANDVLVQSYMGTGAALGVQTGGGVTVAETTNAGVRMISAYRTVPSAGATGTNSSANAETAVVLAVK